MDPNELQEIERVPERGVALILTIAISILLVILVAAFYQTVVGRQKLTHQRFSKREAIYRASAGREDAIARLRRNVMEL